VFSTLALKKNPLNVGDSSDIARKCYDDILAFGVPQGLVKMVSSINGNITHSAVSVAFQNMNNEKGVGYVLFDGGAFHPHPLIIRNEESQIVHGEYEVTTQIRGVEHVGIRLWIRRKIIPGYATVAPEPENKEQEFLYYLNERDYKRNLESAKKKHETKPEKPKRRRGLITKRQSNGIPVSTV